MRHVLFIRLSEHIRALYCWCLVLFFDLGSAMVNHYLHFTFSVCFTFTSPVELFGWFIKPLFIFYFSFPFLLSFSFSLFFLELAYGNIGSGWDLVGNTYWRLLFLCY